MEKRKSQGFDFMGSDQYGWPLPARRTPPVSSQPSVRPTPPPEPQPVPVTPPAAAAPIPPQLEVPVQPIAPPAPSPEPQPVPVVPPIPAAPAPTQLEVPLEPTVTPPAPRLENTPVAMEPAPSLEAVPTEPFDASPRPMPQENAPIPVEPPPAVFVSGAATPWEMEAPKAMPGILCDLVPCEPTAAPTEPVPPPEPEPEPRVRHTTPVPELLLEPTPDGQLPIPVLYYQPDTDDTPTPPVAQAAIPQVRPRTYVEPETMLLSPFDAPPPVPTPQRAVPRFQAPSIFESPKPESGYIPPALPQRSAGDSPPEAAVSESPASATATYEADVTPTAPEAPNWGDWRDVLDAATVSTSEPASVEEIHQRLDSYRDIAYPPIVVDHPNDMAARQVLRLYAGEKSALTISHTYNYNSICFGEDCPQLAALMSRLSRETHGMAQSLGRLALAFGADPRPRVLQSQRGQYWNAGFVRCVRNPRKAILDLIDLERKLLSDMQRFENATRDSGAKKLMSHIIGESEARIGALSHALTLGCV